jgi:hypothetical protein
MLKALLSAVTGIPQNIDDDDVQELWQYQKLIDELDIDDSADHDDLDVDDSADHDDLDVDDSADHPDSAEPDDEPIKKWWQL